MPLFYLRGGRARRQVCGGWLAVWFIDFILSAFRRVLLKQQNSCYVLPSVYIIPHFFKKLGFGMTGPKSFP